MDTDYYRRSHVAANIGLTRSYSTAPRYYTTWRNSWVGPSYFGRNERLMRNSISIIFDNPSRTFIPGSTIFGRVILYNKNLKKSSYIQLKAFGVASIQFYNTNLNNKYFDSQNVFEYQTTLWSPKSGDNERLPRGQKSFGFKFTLPHDCPPTFKATYGSIAYGIEVEVHQSWSTNLKNKTHFIVDAVSDLNNFPIKEKFVKEHIFSGEAGGEIHIPKKIIAIDEELPCKIIVKNFKGSKIKSIKAGILTNITYTIGSNTILPIKKVQSIRSIMLDENDLNLKKDKSKTFNFTLALRKNLPTINNLSMISVENVFFVKISKEDVFSTSADRRIPVTIVPKTLENTQKICQLPTAEVFLNCIVERGPNQENDSEKV